MEKKTSPGVANAAAEDAGIARRAVTQSVAIAIQDAVENLRNINTVAATIIGAASANVIEDPSFADHMQKVIDLAQQITNDAIENLRKVGVVTTEVLHAFPAENMKGAPAAAL